MTSTGHFHVVSLAGTSWTSLQYGSWALRVSIPRKQGTKCMTFLWCSLRTHLVSIPSYSVGLGSHSGPPDLGGHISVVDISEPHCYKSMWCMRWGWDNLWKYDLPHNRNLVCSKPKSPSFLPFQPACSLLFILVDDTTIPQLLKPETWKSF